MSFLLVSHLTKKKKKKKETIIDIDGTPWLKRAHVGGFLGLKHILIHPWRV